MLNLTRDTASDIHLWVNGNTSLTHLAIGCHPAGINCRTRCAHFAVEFLCEGEELVETFLAAHAVATSHYDCRTLEVVLSSFHVAVDNLNHEIGGWNIFCYFWVNYLALSFAFVDGFLHHARAYGCHLWAVFWVDDSSHDIATKSRTNLIEQIVVVLLGLDVVVFADFKFGTVGGKTAEK